MVNSEGHRFAAWGLRLDDLNWEKRRYTGLKSYGSAKTAQLLSMLVFNERFRRHRSIDQRRCIREPSRPIRDRTTDRFTGGSKGTVIDRTLKSPEISAEALYYLGALQRNGRASVENSII